MNHLRTITLLLTILILTCCKPRSQEKAQDILKEETKSSLSGSFSISGAYALFPLVQKWADDFMKIHPNVAIKITSTGTGQGIDELIEKKVQLAMISRPLNDEEKEAGLWVIPVAKDGVAAIVNQNNPYLDRIMMQGLSPDEFLKVFTSEKPLTWGELLDTTFSDKAIAYSRADESGAAEMLAGFFFKKPYDLKGIKVTGDYEMIKSIQNNPLGIGFCNFSFAFNMTSGERTEKIQAIPFDLDYDNTIDRKEMPFKNLEVAHRSIWLGIYPEPLCRELTIGSLGKPVDPVITAFLEYVLSEGQETVKETGLCELNNVYIRVALESLK